MKQQTFVIVGASLAGASAAAALRKQGFDGRIVLLGEESEQPYERPELSKKYLRGEPDVDVYVHVPGFYPENDVQLVMGAHVRAIDIARRAVVTPHGTYPYDRVLLATGAEPRRLDVPGDELEGIATLRTIGDADNIRQRAAKAGAVVVVGGGWIGSEVAATLRQTGANITLVIDGQAPLEHVLGSEIAAVYRDVHVENGVRLITGSRVVRFEGRGRVEAVVTDDGHRFEADLVVVGVGARPRTELASAAGLAVDDGILVDERLESSVPGVFAAGDVANAWHPFYGRRLRVEHWDNAKRQGRAAAGSMLGATKPYDRIPYFYSDQFDLGMEYTGLAQDWDDVVVRGDLDAREFIAFWLKDGRVVAGMNVNTWDVAPSIERLVRSGEHVRRDELADDRRPLDALAEAA